MQMAALKLPKKRKNKEKTADTAESQSEDSSVLKFKPGLLNNLQLVKQASLPITAEDLADEETEVWLLQCPKETSVESILLGNKLKLGGSTFLEGINEEPYEVLSLPLEKQPFTAQKSVTAIVPADDGLMRLVAAPLKGHLLLRERLDDTPVPSITPECRPIHELPPHLKPRHSIYGLELDQIKVKGVKEYRKKKRQHLDTHDGSKTNDTINLENDLEPPSDADVPSKKRKSKLKNSHGSSHLQNGDAIQTTFNEGGSSDDSRKRSSSKKVRIKVEKPDAYDVVSVIKEEKEHRKSKKIEKAGL